MRAWLPLLALFAGVGYLVTRPGYHEPPQRPGLRAIVFCATLNGPDAVPADHQEGCWL